MDTVRTKIGDGGRIVIPADYRKALGVTAGDDVLLRLDAGEVRIFTLAQAVRRAQELVGQHVPPNRSLADELIAERRSEAARE